MPRLPVEIPTTIFSPVITTAAKTEFPAAVRFSTRAYPLLAMLRAARDQQADILWGV